MINNNKHTIKLRYPELEVINQDKCKYAQNQHGCIFKVVAIDVFPEYQFPVPPATVSLQSHGCSTWLQSLPERKKTAAKSQFGNTSGEISLSKSKWNNNSSFICDYTPFEGKVKPGVVIRRCFPGLPCLKRLQHTFSAKKLRRRSFSCDAIRRSCCSEIY